MRAEVRKAILEHYGASSIDELISSDELRSDMNDSVQPGFCRKCGCQVDSLEPDGYGDCEAEGCDGQIRPITYFILGF